MILFVMFLFDLILKVDLCVFIIKKALLLLQFGKLYTTDITAFVKFVT